MDKKREEIAIVEIAKNFLLECRSSVIKEIVSTIGLRPFSLLITNPKLMGKHFALPNKCTLEKLRLREIIEDELKHFKPGSKIFDFQLKQLSKRFGLFPSKILYEYRMLLKRRERKKRKRK